MNTLKQINWYYIVEGLVFGIGVGVGVKVMGAIIGVF
jgi:hypothetical protein